MALIFETEHYRIEAPDRPHIDRNDGGHIVVHPKLRVRDRTRLSSKQAIELIKVTMVVGEAMEIGLQRRGIDIGRINYQDNGNWGVFAPDGPHLHVHLYGRARSARTQKYGEALYLPKKETGFYDHLQPLNEDDISALRSEITRILSSEKYRHFCCSDDDISLVRSEMDVN